MDSRGGIDPMVISGLFLTVLLFGAMLKPLQLFTQGISLEAGITSPAGQLILLVTPMLVLFIIATTWDQIK